MFMWISILLLQGIASFACGCGLEDICRDGRIMSRTVDPLSVPDSNRPVSARCSGPDASSSSWYIRRYMNGNDSLDGLGAPLTLNDSFRQNGNELTIHEVNGFAEGTYHCGVDNDTIQPASLCLFVRGRPVFTSCPGEFEECPSVTQIMAMANDDVSIDTRIRFVDGGFCKAVKKIRTLTIRKGREQMYLCSNLTDHSNRLCSNYKKFRVEQQQNCTGPDITLCKYDIKLMILNFSAPDVGIYNIMVEFENDGNGRGMLMRQYNITLSDELPTNDTFTATTFTTTLAMTTTGPRVGISPGAIAGIVIGFIGISISLIIIVIILLVTRKQLTTIIRKQDETLINFEHPNMLAMTDDKIIIVGDSDEHVKIYSKKDRKKIDSFKLQGGKNPRPRGVSTDGTYIFITDKINQSITKYTFDGAVVKSVGGINGNCGISINRKLGNVYIADQQNSRIQVLNLDLEFLLMFGREGNREGEFKYPRDVAVIDNGTFYVADTNNNRVQVFDSYQRFITEFGNNRLHSPAGICVDSNHVWVADHDNNRICVFDLEGGYIDSLGEKKDEADESKFIDLIGIAVDTDGKIYTADYGGNHVHIIENFQPQL